jgi:hypothetical protein
MHDWVQHLLMLRVQYQALQTGDMQVLAAGKDVLAYARVQPAGSGRSATAGNKIIVIVNRSPEASTVNLKLGGTLLAGASQPQTLLGNAASHWGNDEASVNMLGHSAWIAFVR